MSLLLLVCTTALSLLLGFGFSLLLLFFKKFSVSLLKIGFPCLTTKGMEIMKSHALL
jgi:hypothetical protein